MNLMCATFKMFGLLHIVYLLLALVIGVGLYFLIRKFEGKLCRYVSIIILSLASVLVIVEFIGRILEGGAVGDNLPLNPWNIFVYIAIFVEVTHRESWIKFGYFVVLPLSALSLLVTPTFFNDISATSLSIISYFLINGLLILYSLLQVRWNDVIFSKKDILTCSLNFVMIVACAHIVNVMFGFMQIGAHSNYFGTIGRGFVYLEDGLEGMETVNSYNVVIDFASKLIPIPFLHILPLLGIWVGVAFLLLIPFEMGQNRKNKREHIEELVALGNLKAQQEYRKNNSKGSQILVRGENKARPQVEKNSHGLSQKGGFVSVNKPVNVSNEKRDDK